jgi:hypothetical protein
MPKTEIDYSNTIIYKITCIDDNIKDVYVGHTTNFVQRKYAHKQCCINEKYGSCKLYDVIRNNGGWNNWKMEIINFFNCKDHYEARIKEQEYFVSLNANLNSIEPLPKPKPIIIEPVTEKLIELEKNQKSTNNFVCELCEYITHNKKDYFKHINTNKHVILTGYLQTHHKKPEIYNCNCGKKYNHRQSLHNHKKVCNTNVTTESTDIEKDELINSKDELIKYLINENKEFKTLLIELAKKGSVTI